MPEKYSKAFKFLKCPKEEEEFSHDSILTINLKVIVYIPCYIERVSFIKLHRLNYLRDVMISEGWLP